MKTQAVGRCARVSKIFPKWGFGFLDMKGGPGLYFDRRCVKGAGFDNLKIGSEVRWEEGPRASGRRAVSVTAVQECAARGKGRSPLGLMG